jgi:DNA-directed RNA polymerase specialized sigma24 family protein
VGRAAITIWAVLVALAALASAQTTQGLISGRVVDLGSGRAIAAAVNQLDPSQRQAIECAFYDGLSHSEIATKLNRPLGTIKTCIRQGLIRLREIVRTTYEEPRNA